MKKGLFLLFIAIVFITVGFVCSTFKKDVKESLKIVTTTNKIEIELENKFDIYDILEGKYEDLYFESDNASIASINNEGIIIARSLGTTNIIVRTKEGTIKTIKVKIINSEELKINFKNCPNKLVENTIYDIEYDSNGTYKIKNIILKSSNKDIIEPINNKQIKSLKSGEAEITVNYNNKKHSTCKIEVITKEDNINNDKTLNTNQNTFNTTSDKNNYNPIILIKNISLDKTKINLKEGENTKINVVITPNNAMNKNLIWTSSDENIAIVDQNGLVTAKKPGIATITVSTNNGLTASCEVIVPIVLAKSISLNKNNLSMEKDETFKLKAKVLPTNTSNKEITWISDNEEVATVDENGLVTAKSGGTATIIAITNNGLTAYCFIKIPVIKAETITLDESSLSIESGNTHQLIAKIYPENTTNKKITWISSNKNIATVDENGLVTAKTKGKTTIIASTNNGLTAKCEVSVTGVAAETITLNKTSLSIESNSRHQLIATILPENTTNKNLTWTSTNEKVATVDESGIITAKRPGTAIIIVTTNNGLTAKCEVIVYDPIILAKTITLDKTNLELESGKSSKLTAIILPENTTDKNLTWASNNEEIATVDKNGLVTAKMTGKATITVSTSNGVTATCEITVPVVPAEGIILDKTSLSIENGSTSKLIATILPENTTNKTVTWISDNEEVATVDEKGLVTAKSEGTAMISVITEDGKHKTSCQVNVYKPIITATNIKIDKSSLSILIGKSSKLTATILPENTTNKTVTWTSSNEEIATIDETGLLTAISEGNVTITATTNNGIIDTAQVYVIKPQPEIPDENPAEKSIILDKSDYTIGIDKVVYLKATITPAEYENDDIVWTSSNEEIATVDENGKVTGIKEGTTIITATSGEKQALCNITVEQDISNKKINLTPQNINMLVGNVEQIVARDENGKDITEEVNWTIADNSIIDFIEDGNIKGYKPGTTTLTATKDNISSTVTITVKEILPEIISLSNNSVSIEVNQTINLTATISPENTTDKTLTWTSDNEKIATVDKNGLVTAKTKGTTIITVSTNNGLIAKCEVAVYDPIILAKTITLNKTSISIEKTFSSQLQATITPENTTNKSLSWKSSNEEVATVDENGLITAKKEGSATITVSTNNGLTASCEVTVYDPIVLAEKITLDKTYLSTTIGKNEQLTATISPENTVDKTLTWKSSNEEVATVDENGSVTAKKEGTTTIIVSTNNGLTASCIFEVNEVLAENIALNKTNISIQSSETFKLEATISPENTTYKNIIWLSTDTSVATVDENGLVTAKLGGTAIIKAITNNGLTATCEVTVTEILSESVTLNETNLSIKVGETFKLEANVLPENTTNKKVDWRSVNPEIATVDETGKVTGIKEGTTTVLTTTSGGQVAGCLVHVTNIIANSISLDKTSITIANGKSFQLKATILPANTTNKLILWNSTNKDVITVDTNGLATAKGPGTATIVAGLPSSNGLIATCAVTVYQPVTSINITANNKDLNITTTTTQLTANVSPSTANNREVTWKSSNTNVATVNSSGKVTRVGEGTTTITATAKDGSGVSASETIQVQKEKVVIIGASTIRQIAGLRSTAKDGSNLCSDNGFKTAHILYHGNYGYKIYSKDFIHNQNNYSSCYGSTSPYGSNYFIKSTNHASNYKDADLFFVAKSGTGIGFLKGDATNYLKEIISTSTTPSSHYSVAVLLGGNDIKSALGKNADVTNKMVEDVAKDYYTYYEKLAKSIKSNSNLYIISLNSYKDSNGKIITKYNKTKEEDYRRTVFRNKLKTLIVNNSSMKYVDINSACKNDYTNKISTTAVHYDNRCTAENDFTYNNADDGHYDRAGAQKVFYYIMNGMGVLDNKGKKK